MKQVRVADVSEFVLDGTHASPIRTDSGVPVLSAQNIKDGQLNFKTDRFTTSAEYLMFQSRLDLRAGDLLLTIVGTIGRAAIVTEVRPLIFQRSVAIIRPNKNALDPRFLFHSTQTHEFQAQLARSTNASSQAGVYLGRLKEITIGLPSLMEQRRIAEILDWAEALRVKRRAALAQLDSFSKSIFLDLFGDSVTNSKNWPVANLKTFFNFRTGKLDSNAAVASGKYPFFTCSRDDLRIDNFAFDCEALLLSGNNASADYSVKYYKGKFNAYQRTYVITLVDERNSYHYSKLALEHRLAELKRISKGTNTKYLTMELLNRIRIPVPPNDLQRMLDERLAKVEGVRSAQLVSLAELDALFSSLQHRAFRGEL